MIELGVNIDHIATVRQARRTYEPDPVWAAVEAHLGGADGITVHLREDRRHIQDEDVRRLRELTHIKLNLEMAATEEMVAIAARVRPDVITLVPERRQERTTEGGLDLVGQHDAVARAVAMAREAGIKVSLFVAPDHDSVERSRALGADQVELHTGEYCHASAELPSPGSRARVAHELERLATAAARAETLGLEVAAGHGLTRHNVGPVAALEPIVEVNIGHSIVADAIFVGLPRAVRELREAMDRARR